MQDSGYIQNLATPQYNSEYVYEKSKNDTAVIDAQTQYNLGVMYQTGQGTLQNLKKSFELFQQAATTTPPPRIII